MRRQSGRSTVIVAGSALTVGILLLTAFVQERDRASVQLELVGVGNDALSTQSIGGLYPEGDGGVPGWTVEGSKKNIWQRTADGYGYVLVNQEPPTTHKDHPEPPPIELPHSWVAKTQPVDTKIIPSSIYAVDLDTPTSTYMSAHIRRRQAGGARSVHLHFRGVADGGRFRMVEHGQDGKSTGRKELEKAVGSSSFVWGNPVKERVGRERITWVEGRGPIQQFVPRDSWEDWRDGKSPSVNEIKEGPEAHEVVKSTMPKLLHTHAQARAHKEAKRARMTSLVEQESSDPIQPQISSLEVVKDGLDLNLAGENPGNHLDDYDWMDRWLKHAKAVLTRQGDKDLSQALEVEHIPRSSTRAYVLPHQDDEEMDYADFVYAHSGDAVQPVRLAEGVSAFPRWDANVDAPGAFIDGSGQTSDYLKQNEAESSVDGWMKGEPEYTDGLYDGEDADQRGAWVVKRPQGDDENEAHDSFYKDRR